MYHCLFYKQFLWSCSQGGAWLSLYVPLVESATCSYGWTCLPYGAWSCILFSVQHSHQPQASVHQRETASCSISIPCCELISKHGHSSREQRFLLGVTINVDLSESASKRFHAFPTEMKSLWKGLTSQPVAVVVWQLVSVISSTSLRSSTPPTVTDRIQLWGQLAVHDYPGINVTLKLI